jgi:uncharacterized Zn-finger protein
MSNFAQNTSTTAASNDIVYTDTTEVWCEGNSVATGHPRVFLHLNREGTATCPYCSKHFVLKTTAA